MFGYDVWGAGGNFWVCVVCVAQFCFVLLV